MANPMAIESGTQVPTTLWTSFHCWTSALVRRFNGKSRPVAATPVTVAFAPDLRLEVQPTLSSLVRLRLEGLDCSLVNTAPISGSDRIDVSGRFTPVQAQPVRLRIDSDSSHSLTDVLSFQGVLPMSGEFEVTVRVRSEGGEQTTVLRKSFQISCR